VGVSKRPLEFFHTFPLVGRGFENSGERDCIGGEDFGVRIAVREEAKENIKGDAWYVSCRWGRWDIQGRR
jgi:hypothetical protein